MAASNNFQQFILPAGKYWVGDLSNVFPKEGLHSEIWPMVLFVSNHFQDCKYIKIGETEVWASATEDGQGIYNSFGGFEFPVDSGLLGIINQKTIDFLNPSNILYDDVTFDINQYLDNCGQFIDMDEEFLVKFKDFEFQFGDIYIDTSDEYVENDDEDEDEKDNFDQYKTATYR